MAGLSQGDHRLNVFLLPQKTRIDLDCCALEIYLKEKLDSEALEKYRVREEEPADEVFFNNFSIW